MGALRGVPEGPLKGPPSEHPRENLGVRPRGGREATTWAPEELVPPRGREEEASRGPPGSPRRGPRGRP